MMNGLIGVLSRFRKEETVETCDIEQMFQSFHVNPEHRDFLRFLWFKDNDLNGKIYEYRMNVHLFGAVSSPGVANFGLRSTAESGQEQFGQEAANFLQIDFYVDDGLNSLLHQKMHMMSSKAPKPCVQPSICAYTNLLVTVKSCWKPCLLKIAPKT